MVTINLPTVAFYRARAATTVNSIIIFIIIIIVVFSKALKFLLHWRTAGGAPPEICKSLSRRDF